MRLGDLDALKEDLFIKFGNLLPNGLLDEIDNAPTVPLPDFKEGYKQAINDGKTNFSRPQGEWIPVSERLPDEKINPNTNDFEKVLCSTIWGDVRPYKYGKPKGHDKAHFWLGGGIMDEYVIAWKPLPKPYELQEARKE